MWHISFLCTVSVAVVTLGYFCKLQHSKCKSEFPGRVVVGITMPPKSKGKNKSSDKTKKDDTNSRERISEGPLTEVDREYYRAQIADLERRLQK